MVCIDTHHINTHLANLWVYVWLSSKKHYRQTDRQTHKLQLGARGGKVRRAYTHTHTHTRVHKHIWSNCWIQGFVPLIFMSWDVLLSCRVCFQGAHWWLVGFSFVFLHISGVKILLCSLFSHWWCKNLVTNFFSNCWCKSWLVGLFFVFFILMV